MDNKPRNLLFKYFSGSCNTDELNLIDEWIHRSPQNKQDFRKMERLWFNRDVDMDLEVDVAWQKVSEALQGTPMTVSHGKTPSRWQWISGMAAAVTLFAVGTYFFISQETYTLLKAQDGVARYELPDGSRVWLKEDSRLRYRFEEDERTLQLSGTGYFEVERDEDRPFFVTMKRARITVLGTSFMAQTHNDQDRVHVTSGSVSFADQDEESNYFDLAPGEEAQLEFATGDLIKNISSDANLLAWQSGVLVFNKTPLRSVVQSLIAHYQVDISLESDEMGNCLITSRFNNQPIDEVLEVIEKLLSAELIRTENGYILKGQGC